MLELEDYNRSDRVWGTFAIMLGSCMDKVPDSGFKVDIVAISWF